MNNNETDDLFVQVRTAHRLLAAYYQRLLPTLEQIAHQVDTEFYFWRPHGFDTPSRVQGNPFTKWQWDLLPATITRYVFKQVAFASKVTHDDYIVEFLVINDTGIHDEKKGRAQPDALKLKIDVKDAQSVLRVGIYRAASDQKTNNGFHELWDKVAYPKYDGSFEAIMDKGFLTTGFEVPLTAMMNENGVESIKSQIKKCLAVTLELAEFHRNKLSITTDV
jgi:hypothetical protein